MSAYLQKHKRRTLLSRWDSAIVSIVTKSPVYPAKAVRATQEYGDQEMTYSRMTISAIFAIFHSFCSRWTFFMDSCLLLWQWTLPWTLPLTFPTALTHTHAQTHTAGYGCDGMHTPQT